MDRASDVSFRKVAVVMFRQARSSQEAVRAAVEQYLRNGYREGFVGEEIIDYLGVDTPSILDDAGYSETEADAAIAVLDELHPSLFREFHPKN
jgi:hypothetical protein